MKTQYTVPLAIVVGIGLGACAVEGIHARVKPPVYVIAEVEVTNPEGYAKEYVPPAQAATKAASVRLLAQAGKVTALDGPPPQARRIVQVWFGIGKLQARRHSTEFNRSRKIQEK